MPSAITDSVAWRVMVVVRSCLPAAQWGLSIVRPSTDVTSVLCKRIDAPAYPHTLCLAMLCRNLCFNLIGCAST